MKKYALRLILASLSILAAGCSSSIETGTNLYDQSLCVSYGRTIAHTNANISGVYLLYFIPIACGDPENPGNTLWFQNTVSIENALDMLTKNSNELGATKTYNIKSNTYSSTWMPSFFILWVRHVDASGNAIR